MKDLKDFVRVCAESISHGANERSKSSDFRAANPVPEWASRLGLSEDGLRKEFAEIRLPDSCLGMTVGAYALSVDECHYVYLYDDMSGEWHFMDDDGEVEDLECRLPEGSFVVDAEGGDATVSEGEDKKNHPTPTADLYGFADWEDYRTRKYDFFREFYHKKAEELVDTLIADPAKYFIFYTGMRNSGRTDYELSDLVVDNDVFRKALIDWLDGTAYWTRVPGLKTKSGEEVMVIELDTAWKLRGTIQAEALKVDNAIKCELLPEVYCPKQEKKAEEPKKDDDFERSSHPHGWRGDPGPGIGRIPSMGGYNPYRY